MKRKMTILALAALVSAVAMANSSSNPDEVTHLAFQAVDPYGDSTFTGATTVVLDGILLNNPEDWLNPTPNPAAGMFFMGGEWEIFIQGEGDDEAGTACWIGQNYGNRPNLEHPADSYTNDEWLAELYRLNHDPNSLKTDRPHIFRAGDRVRVTGRYLWYNGKLIVNENHFIAPEFNFTLDLLKPAVGLPKPIEIALEDLKTETDDYIFGHDPRAGGELYQSRRVRLEGVYINDPDQNPDEEWAPGKWISVSDGQTPERTFRVRLGYGEGISRYPAPEPTDMIDIIGIMNQSGYKKVGEQDYYVDGYYLVVLDYDGSRRVLGDAAYLRGTLPGDINNDFKVDLLDFVELAESWLLEMPGFYLPVLPMNAE